MTKNTIQPSLRPRGRGATVLVAATALVLASCTNGGSATDPTSTPLTTTQTLSQTATGDPPDTTQPDTGPPDSSQPDEQSPTTTVETDQVATTVTGPSPLGSPTLDQKRQSVEGWNTELMVTGARLATHPTFDRVVFDFSGAGNPGWFVDYTDTPTQQGSGFPVEFQGNTALYVAIEGTNYPILNEPEAPVLGTVPGTGGVVQEVIYTSIFEGRTEYVIGVDSRQPYSVTLLQEPTRLVIDILQPQ